MELSMKMTPEQLGFHRGSAPSWPRFGPVGATVGFAMEGGWLLCCHTQPPSLQGMAGAPCPSAGWGRAVLPARGAVCTAGRAASALCCQPRREQRFHHHLLPQPRGKHSWGCGLHPPPLRSALGGVPMGLYLQGNGTERLPWGAASGEEAMHRSEVSAVTAQPPGHGGSAGRKPQPALF